MADGAGKRRRRREKGRKREGGRHICIYATIEKERKVNCKKKLPFAVLISLMRPDHLTGDFSFFFPFLLEHMCNCAYALALSVFPPAVPDQPRTILIRKCRKEINIGLYVSVYIFLYALLRRIFIFIFIFAFSIFNLKQ